MPDGWDLITAVGAGVLGGVIAHLIVAAAERCLPRVLLIGLGVVCFLGILGGTAVALFFLASPYVGEIHSALRQILATLWAAVILFGGSRVRRVKLPFWQRMAPVFIKAALVFVLLGTAWNIDLGWEYTFREPLAALLTGVSITAMLLLENFELRKPGKSH